MKTLRHPSVAIGLVFCILSVGAFFAVQSPAHAFHHAHHKASTHASLLCSWMCAAGQVDQSSDPILETPSIAVDIIESPVYDIKSYTLIRSFLPRGPPVR